MGVRRIYHPYWIWEDWQFGMWRRVPSEEAKIMLKSAIKFTGDHVLYGSWMMKVVKEWPMACEHNLTDLSQNRKAWIGHSAVQLAISVPEYITRQAWGFLTEEQQKLANEQADKAIQSWEVTYRGEYSNKDCQLHFDLGEAVLSCRNPR